MKLIAKLLMAAFVAPALLLTSAFAQTAPATTAKKIEVQWFGQATATTLGIVPTGTMPGFNKSYGTFPVLNGTPAEYTEALGKSATKVFVMNPGDKLEF